MGNQIIQSIKTIAQSLVDNAGYDKTRGGLIVGVNTITNTYSVKVDGVTYPIVRAVDDVTYNIGDVVKVVIPCNQATQMYISSSVLSDNSLGNKIANATTLAEDAKQLGLDNQVEIKDVSDVANSKNKTFRQDTAPTEGMSSGDVWIDTSDNNTLYVYDGTQWVFSGGGNGQDGLNNATILLYHRGATAPDKPTAEVTYTFADASLSPASALNGWMQAIPQVDGNPCWVIAATASATTATDTIGISEWSTQVKFVEDGVQGATGATGATGKTGEVGATGSTGLNQATIFLYSRTTSTKPSSPTTYTFASGVLSPLPSNWSRSVPANDGNPCYVTTAIAIGYGSDVTITADAWSDPTVLVENGAEGYSPTVTTGTASDGSTTITVTNKDGSTTTELVDGTARDDAATAQTTASNAQTSINNLEIGGRNLIVERNVSNGWVNSSGTLTNSSGYIATDYIPVTPGDTIVFQLWSPSSKNSWIDDTYFDSDKNYVTGYNGEYINSNHIIKLYTVPSGASYVRMSYSWADGYKAKLEKGNKPTDWAPAPEDVDADISAVQDKVNPLLTRVLIDNNSVDIVDLNGNVLASYGVDAIIGKNTEMQMVAGSSGIKFEKDGEYSFKLNPKDVITDVATSGTPSEIYGSTGTDLAISGTAYKVISVIGANGTDYTSSAVGHQRYPIVAIKGKTPSQISYPVTIKYFDGATFIDTPSAELIGQFEATDYLSTTKRISIGHCITPAVLTSSGGSLYFTIPLNRVLREDAVLKSISFRMNVRASYADGQGKYIIKGSSKGTDMAEFDYDPNKTYSGSNPIMTFYDGADNKRTPSKKPIVQIEDGCMLYFEWVTGTNYYFAGNSTLNGKLNNNACTAFIDTIVINVGYDY